MSMRKTTMFAGVIALAAAGAWLPPAAGAAANVNIGVQTGGVSLGINIGSPPPLLVVPGTPVYRAPSLPYDYFVYRKRYYLYHEGFWYQAQRYNGPWVAVAIEQLPRPILAVPVQYYKHTPSHWKRHGPPPWAEERGHERGRGHDGDRGHGKGKGHGRGHD